MEAVTKANQNIGGKIVINDLLRQWGQIEPHRCEISKSETVFLSVLDAYFTFHNFKHSEDLLDFEDWGKLQRAVQQAIASHKDWTFNLCLIHHPADGKFLYGGSIWRKQDVEPFSDTNEEPAIALLSAYLQALKAEKLTEVAS